SGSVQSLSHFWFRLSGPEAGSGGDGTSHLLVLQQLDVQISLGRPSGAGDVPEPGGSEVERRVATRDFGHFALGWAAPRPAQAVMAPLICWSFSSSTFRYLLADQAVPAMCRSLAAARLSADCPSGNAPTTRVRRRISRRMRSSGLLVRIRRQCSSGKA